MLDYASGLKFMKLVTDMMFDQDTTTVVTESTDGQQSSRIVITYKV